jgi:hypothetical protein
MTMSNDYMATKYRGEARLAVALKELGWQVHGETAGDPDAKDLINLALWHGYASHPDFPGIIVVCGIDDKKKTEYVQPGWPSFKPNGTGVFYHIEEDGIYRTMGNGAGWAGDLAEGKQHAQHHAEFIHRRAANLTKAKQRKAEKERKRLARIAKEQARAAKQAAQAEAKQAREAARAAKAAATGAIVKPARSPKSSQAGPVPCAAGLPSELEAQEAHPGAAAGKPQRAEAKAPKPAAAAHPEDLVVFDLKPLSPLILDPKPVVVDVLVTALLDEPAWLPPGTDFPAIAATKIAAFYGFDTDKAVAAARNLTALLKDPAISEQDPKQRSMTLRMQARTLLN